VSTTGLCEAPGSAGHTTQTPAYPCHASLKSRALAVFDPSEAPSRPLRTPRPAQPCEAPPQVHGGQTEAPADSWDAARPRTRPTGETSRHGASLEPRATPRPRPAWLRRDRLAVSTHWQVEGLGSVSTVHARVAAMPLTAECVAVDPLPLPWPRRAASCLEVAGWTSLGRSRGRPTQLSLESVSGPLLGLPGPLVQGADRQRTGSQQMPLLLPSLESSSP
jgi:hypothetical protein